MCVHTLLFAMINILFYHYYTVDILGPAKCPDYHGVLIFQVSLHDNASFGTTAIGVWIMQVSTFSSVLINRFHCSRICISTDSPTYSSYILLP